METFTIGVDTVDTSMRMSHIFRLYKNSSITFWP